MINLAVVGPNSDTLINLMRKYTYFNVSEHELNDENCKNYDFYIFTIDSAFDVNKQMKLINTGIKNSLILVLTNDAYVENKNLMLSDKKAFIFSKDSMFSEKMVFEMMFYICKQYCSAKNQELELCRNLLEKWGYYKLSSEEKNTVNCMYYCFLETQKKNLISKFINDAGITNEELLAILPFRECYVSQSQNVKSIVRKVISRKFIPHYIPSFRKNCDENC